MPARGVLVTGTDTGIGKTWVACALARALRGAPRLLRVGVMKPCETGVDAAWPPPPGAATHLPEGSDAAALADASGCAAPPTDILPAAFRLPAAPSVAAAAEGAHMDLDAIDAAYARLAAAHDVVLVEGAGGLLVPLVDDFDFADLAERLGLSVLVVARTGLGTLNHTTLTVRAAQARGLDVLGVVLNAGGGETSASDRENLSALPALLGDVPVLAELPHGRTPAAASMERVVAAVTGREPGGG